MLEYLKMYNLGPAPELDFRFGSRINVLTGDNGLGKTFALDVAWWAMTRCWADGRVIHPSPSERALASIEYHVHGRGGPNKPVTCNYDRKSLEWANPQRRPPIPGLVIYARIDGGFSLWDPERNYSHDADTEGKERPAAYQFSKRQLWEGLKDDSGTLICRGLLEDWETWRLKGNGAFDLLCDVLKDLSPPGEPPLAPGPSVRLPDKGAQEIPTLVTPYSQVPIHHASAGIRRILSLAYMLVWAWIEHNVAAQLRQREKTQRIVLLWDEVEAHLHPQWQRAILPAILNVIRSRFLAETDGELQLIATTHAPLVLASLETNFDPKLDKLFNLALEDKHVRLHVVPWAKHGDVIEWLRSPAFSMRTGYSIEAERAMTAAQAFLAGRQDQLSPPFADRESIESELKRTLAPEDPFWPRWLAETGSLA